MNNDELYHYGVPGMRWGQRKAALKSDYKARVKKANGDYDKITQAKADYKKAKHKLNDEKKAAEKAYKKTPEYQIAQLKRKQRAGAVATVAALGVIGSVAVSMPYKVLYDVVNELSK